jgi:hypothetical protein
MIVADVKALTLAGLEKRGRGQESDGRTDGYFGQGRQGRFRNWLRSVMTY